MPPGPNAGRRSGNLAEFAIEPLTFLRRCVEDWGDVVSIGRHDVLVALPSDIERVLVDREGAFVKIRPGVRRRSHTGFPEAMMNSEGEDWLRKRRRIQPVFGSERIDQHAALVCEATVDWIRSWPADALIDVHPEMSRLALSVAAAQIVGKQLDDVDAVRDSVRAIMRLTATPVRLPAWVPSKTNRSLRRSLGQLDAVLDRLVDGDPDAASRGYLLEHLMQGRPVPSRSEMKDELATLLMSGYETTADALTWIIYLLGTHPEALARASHEVQTPGSDIHARHPYLAAVVKEAMRLYPPAWLTSRESVTRVRLGDYELPAGTTVTVSQWVTHRDERWFSSPEVFLPERWLSPPAWPRYAYFPFGGGPRACIGATMATREIELVLATLLSRIHLEVVRPKRVKIRAALALQPQNVRARLRATSFAQSGSLA